MNYVFDDFRNEVISLNIGGVNFPGLTISKWKNEKIPKKYFIATRSHFRRISGKTTNFKQS